MLMAHPRICAPSELVQEIKTGSSKWLKTKGARHADFHWQGGTGSFRSARPTDPGWRPVNQAEHHRKVTFQEEYRRLLGKYGVGYDERYVWD